MKILNKQTRQQIQLLDSQFNLLSLKEAKSKIENSDVCFALNVSDRLKVIKQGKTITAHIKEHAFSIKTENIEISLEQNELQLQNLDEVYIQINRTGLDLNSVQILDNNHQAVLVKQHNPNSDLMKYLAREWKNLNFKINSNGYNHHAISQNKVKFNNIEKFL